MSPVALAALATWEWRPSLCLVTVFFSCLFGWGWWRLRNRGHVRLASVRSLISYGLGVAILLYALQSFVDVYGGLLLYIHMIQHILLLMFVPCLLLWADPFPIMLWALPEALRSHLTRHLQGDAAFRRIWIRATPIGVLYALYVGIIILWHDPALYNQAQNNSLVHDLEHITFFGTALLFWWPIFAAGPHIHGHVTLVGKMAVLLLCVPPHVVIGALLSFAETPIYTFYEAVPRPWDLDIMQDQMLAGVIMWIPTSMMYLAGVVILLAQYLSSQKGHSGNTGLPAA